MAITCTIKSVRVCNPSQVALIITAGDGTRAFDIEVVVDNTLTLAEIKKLVNDRKQDYAVSFAAAAALQPFVGSTT